jgi:hypothetical protein
MSEFFGLLVAEGWFWYDFSETSVPYTPELQQVFFAPLLPRSYLSYPLALLAAFLLS